MNTLNNQKICVINNYELYQKVPKIFLKVMTDYFLIDSIKKSSDYDIICTISVENDVTVQEVEEKNTYKKLIKKTFSLNDNILIEYFRREVYLLKMANLEGFPFLKFYGYNPSENGKSFLLTEYYGNGSLNDAINEKFSVNKEPGKYDTTIMKILYGVAFGLNYLHKRKIIHRDIKPDNIFIDENMNPYIGDFGFARIFREGIKITGNIGTLFYMAPEIIDEDEINPDVSIDTYSLAITTLQLLGYKLTLKIDDSTSIPIDELTDEDQFTKWVKEGKRYAEINNVPNDFKEFISECWDKNPKKRWTMDKILRYMREKRLFLRNTNADEFFEYVKQLDDALVRHQHKEEEEEKNDSDNDSNHDEEEEEEEETKDFDF